MEGCFTFQCRGEGFCFSDEGTSSLVGGEWGALVLMEEFFEKNCRMGGGGGEGILALFHFFSVIDDFR